MTLTMTVVGKTVFSSASPSSWSQNLQGLFSWHGALLGPSTRLAHCSRSFRDTRNTVRYAELGSEVSGRCQNQLTLTLITYALVKKSLFSWAKIGRGPFWISFPAPWIYCCASFQNIEPRRNVLDVQMKIGKSKKYVKKIAVFFAASHICPSFSRSI